MTDPFEPASRTIDPNVCEPSSLFWPGFGVGVVGTVGILLAVLVVWTLHRRRKEP